MTPLSAGAEQLTVVGEGADEIGIDAGNRFLIGLEHGLQEFLLEPPVMRIEMDNEIPLARGLGSSAAACVAGLLAAEAMAGAKLGDERILRIATEIDGHPDNVAAALFGGFVIVGHDDGGAPMAARFDPPDRSARGRVHSRLGDAHGRDARGAARLREARRRRAQRGWHGDGRGRARRAAVSSCWPEWATTECTSLIGCGISAQLPDIVDAARDAGALGAALSGAGSAMLALARRRQDRRRVPRAPCPPRRRGRICPDVPWSSGPQRTALES